MTAEHESKIIKREPPKRILSRTFRSVVEFVLERISGTPAREEKFRRQFYMEWERYIQEEHLPDLEKKGLLGIRQLSALPEAQRGVYGGLKGFVRGGMFLLAGTVRGEIEGEIRTCSSIQFAWRPKVEKGLVISEIPVDEFVFEVNDEVRTPTVEFHINPISLTRSVGRAPTRFRARTFSHPNDYLKPKFLDEVILTLDSGTYQSLALPTTLPKE